MTFYIFSPGGIIVFAYFQSCFKHTCLPHDKFEYNHVATEERKRENSALLVYDSFPCTTYICFEKMQEVWPKIDPFLTKKVQEKSPKTHILEEFFT